MPVKSWVLLDGITNIQSQTLPTEQLQLAILKMPERDWSRFYVWTEGWKSWQLLKDFLHSDQKDFSLSKEVTVAKEDTFTKSMTTINSTEDTITPEMKDFDGGNLKNYTTKPPEKINFKEINDYKRRAVRHELKIEILISNQKGKTFKSYSKNISLTGTFLEDTVPAEFYGTPFDLIVVNRHSLNMQNSRVQIRAESVNEGQTHRVRFVDLNEIQKQKLMTLLNDYITQQAQLKKSS